MHLTTRLVVVSKIEVIITVLVFVIVVVIFLVAFVDNIDIVIIVC